MYKITNTGTKCEILLYSGIEPGGYEFGISALDVINQIKNAGDNISMIELRINSEGGDVFEAFAMYNYLKQHKAKVRVYIDGIAASAASIVAMSGEVIMPKNAMMMIHNPMTYAAGDSEELREQAEILDKVRAQIAGIYAEKSGMTPESIMDLMTEESWITADEALAMNLCDKVIEARNNFTPSNATAHADIAVQNERARIKAIDDLHIQGFEDEIRDAKYVHPIDAKELAYKLMSSGKFARAMDNGDLQGITPGQTDSAPTDRIKAMAEIINRRRGY